MTFASLSLLIVLGAVAGINASEQTSITLSDHNGSISSQASERPTKRMRIRQDSPPDAISLPFSDTDSPVRVPSHGHTDVAVPSTSLAESSKDMFAAHKLPPLFYELIYDYLDGRSRFSLRMTSKNLCKIVSHLIMNNDRSDLQKIVWKKGPTSQTAGSLSSALFLNYLFNKTVKECQVRVLCTLCKQNPSVASLESLARNITFLQDHAPRLGQSAQEVIKAFESCYRALVSRRQSSPEELPFMWTAETGVRGNNLAERDMALFLHYIFSTRTLFSVYPGEVDFFDLNDFATLFQATGGLLEEPEGKRALSNYQDNESSVVIRFLKLQRLLLDLKRLENNDSDEEDVPGAKARVYKEIFGDNGLSSLEMLVAFARELILTTIDEDMAETFHAAVLSYQHDVQESEISHLETIAHAEYACYMSLPQTHKYLKKSVELYEALLKLCDDASYQLVCSVAHYNYLLWKEDSSKRDYLLRSAELYEKVLKKCGDTSSCDMYLNTALAHGQLWLEDSGNVQNLARSRELFELILTKFTDDVSYSIIHDAAITNLYMWEQDESKVAYLRRSVELFERALPLFDDSASFESFLNAALANRSLWQQDTSQITHLTRAIELIEKGQELLSNPSSENLFVFAWARLKKSMVESAHQAQLFAESKALWKNALESLWKEGLALGLEQGRLDSHAQECFKELEEVFSPDHSGDFS